ncbi:hypothetical protein ACFSC3_10825 [Sphingomonas floccifaciens]|uniref:YubB ferredoxin-like domain-containing protein n=1 Tax=Sphingomonas floccifaciens TaxID=1844115 RepID=A0ABW4NET9_9SPHN
MYIVCDEMWNSVEIYGLQSEIDRFKRRFIFPAPADNWAGSTHAIELCRIGGEETWNFREIFPAEPGYYSFAFDTLAIFPTDTFEDLARLFPMLAFDCECIADDDRSMGYGWFNTPPGGEDFRDDYDVPADYWTVRGCKRSPADQRRHEMVVAALRQNLRETDSINGLSSDA